MGKVFGGCIMGGELELAWSTFEILAFLGAKRVELKKV